MAEEIKQEVMNQVVEQVKQEPQEEVKTLTQKETKLCGYMVRGFLSHTI